MKRLQDCGAYIQNQRLFGVLAVSRSIGDFEMKKAGRESRNEATYNITMGVYNEMQ